MKPNLEIEKSIIEKDLKKCFSSYGDKLVYLKQRWANESDYEDFDEYKKIIKKIFKKFRFNVEVIHKDFHITLIHKVGIWCTDIEVKSNCLSYGFSKLVYKGGNNGNI